jgi:hypothetical protein
MNLRTICLILVLILAFIGVGNAQTEFPNRAVGANIGVCPTCTPQINGGVWYANAITKGDHPTYSFSLVNIDRVTITNWKPLDVQVVTTAETGFAQHVGAFNRFNIFALGTAGVATNSTNTGFSYGGGSMAITSIGRGWMIGAYLRVAKQTIAADVGWKVGLTVALGAK